MGLCILRGGTMKFTTGYTNRQIKKWGRGSAFLIFLSAFAFGGMAVTADARDLAVIAGKEFPADTLSMSTLKDIYMGEKQVLNGVRLKPIDQRDNQQIKFDFLNRVLRLSKDGYVTYWNNRLFREGGIPPIPKNDSAEVIATIEGTDGAIGYVWLDQAKAAKDSLKILLTITVGQ
jgi:ABC-type phosphate transport system substrate-binding protein